MDCKTCGRWLDSYERADNHYWLGRIYTCYGDNFDPNLPCDEYVNAKDQFTYEFSAIRTWRKESDGNIYPSTYGPEGNLYDAWFRYGFYAATRLLNDPNFKKECSNCARSNPHIVNKCKENTLCDKYEIDYLRSFDKRFYGHLCDCCKNDCKSKEDKLIWECKNFKGE
jgi:hypothetical protein